MEWFYADLARTFITDFLLWRDTENIEREKKKDKRTLGYILQDLSRHIIDKTKNKENTFESGLGSVCGESDIL